MVLGRVIFGIGGESLDVASSRIAAEWFKGRGLGLAMSLHLSMARIAAASTENLSPFLANKFSIPFVVWFGVMVCGISFACTFVVSMLDRPSSRVLAGVACVKPPAFLKAKVSKLDVTDVSMQTLNVSEGIVKEGGKDDSAEGYVEEDERFRFGTLKGLSWSFWMLCLTTMALYGKQKWYPGDPEMAGRIMSIPDLLSSVGTPLCGLFIDRFGYRATLLPVTGLLLLTSHALMGWTTLTPIVPMVILGIGYSMFASALWTCIPYLVGPHQLATSYGLLSTSLNLTLTILPLVVAKIRSTFPDSFVPVEAFFIGIACVAIFLSIGLCIVDERYGALLRLVHHPDDPIQPVIDVEDHNVARATSQATLADLPIINIEANNSNNRRMSRRRSSARSHYSSHYSSKGGEDEQHSVIRVIGNGVVVSTPRTQVHHDHARKHAGEKCTCGEIPLSPPPVQNTDTSGSSRSGGGGGGGGGNRRMPATAEERDEEVGPLTPVPGTGAMSARSDELYCRGSRFPLGSPPPASAASEPSAAARRVSAPVLQGAPVGRTSKTVLKDK
ncbi:hypothetical protein HDU86_008308 [Geranomyces michiganensis]|nr:hypothetical protein HDU86_008308 [Geranomyces michiganensis]